ncbi:MAG: LamG-like jellyroll fold domain-containing protein [Verrucomicrobiota bacterium]
MNNFEKLVALLEGNLARDEFAELEEAMRHDPTLRQEWIRLQSLEGELEQRFSGSTATAQRQSHPPGHLLALAAVFAVSALLIALFLLAREPASTYAPADLSGLEPVAIISAIEEVKWQKGEQASLSVGSLVKPGVLMLESGKVKLDFFCGAAVVLAGPAELQVLSEKRAFLLHGKAAATVPLAAVGFTIRTPDAAVVDLGTEFAVAVDKQGESFVHVYDGEVRVSLLGDDGATRSSSPVTTGDSLQVQPKAARLTPTLLKGNEYLPAPPPFGLDGLQVPDSYREMVLNAQPVGYWTFDADLKNEASDSWTVEAVGPGVSLYRGAVLFEQVAGEISCLRSTELLPQIEDSNYTIGMWVKPASIHYATLAAICTDQFVDRSSPHHLSVIELMHNSHLIHPPNSIRFLNRWEEDEVNVFSSRPFVPGKWHHIVAVKDEEHSAIYLNGHLVTQAKVTSQPDDQRFRLVFGQIDHLRSKRQLHGLMDEVAFYLRALSEEEIAMQFETMAAANPLLFNY